MTPRLPPTLLITAIALLVAPLTPSTAWAQPPSAKETQPQILYREAYEAMGRKDWLEARRILIALWLKAKTHDVAASLGQVEYHLGNAGTGAYYMALAVSLVPPQEDAATVAKYEAYLAELKKHVATIHVAVEPVNADLSLDGQEVQLTPDAELFVDPGDHTLIASMAGFKSANANVQAVAGAESNAKLKLEQQASSEPNDAAGGMTSGASSHLTAPPVDSGTSHGKRNWTVPAVLLGVTAMSTVATAWLHLAASSDEDKVKELKGSLAPGGTTACNTDVLPSECSSLRDALRRHDREADWANATLILAGAAAVGTVIAYELSTPSRSPSAQTHVRAVVGAAPSGGAVLLQGTF